MKNLFQKEDGKQSIAAKNTLERKRSANEKYCFLFCLQVLHESLNHLSSQLRSLQIEQQSRVNLPDHPHTRLFHKSHRGMRFRQNGACQLHWAHWPEFRTTRRDNVGANPTLPSSALWACPNTPLAFVPAVNWCCGSLKSRDSKL